MAIAHKVAEAAGNDGMNLDALIREAEAAHGIRQERNGDFRYLFADSSAICTSNAAAWDIEVPGFPWTWLGNDDLETALDRVVESGPFLLVWPATDTSGEIEETYTTASDLLLALAEAQQDPALYNRRHIVTVNGHAVAVDGPTWAPRVTRI